MVAGVGGFEAREREKRARELALAKQKEKNEASSASKELDTALESKTEVAPQAYTAQNQQMLGNLRGMIGGMSNLDEVRRQAQQQVMDKSGAMARQLQSGASRGGVAGRGAGTGALRAPAQQALMGGMRGVEADMVQLEGQRLAQVAAATGQMLQSQMAAMGFDANTINMALSMKEKSLSKVAHRLGDASFAPVLQRAEADYQRNIQAGMDPANAAARYDVMITM